jgi:hypothetical protein
MGINNTTLLIRGKEDINMELQAYTTITTTYTNSGDRITAKSSNTKDRILSKFDSKDRPLPQFHASAQKFAETHKLRIFACGEILGGYIWLCDNFNGLPEKSDLTVTVLERQVRPYLEVSDSKQPLSKEVVL